MPLYRKVQHTFLYGKKGRLTHTDPARKNTLFIYDRCMVPYGYIQHLCQKHISNVF